MVSTLNVEALVRSLARCRVRFVLFGTLGATAYGADLATRDMDICPATDVTNLRGLADLLTERDAKPRHVPGHTHTGCERHGGTLLHPLIKLRWSCQQPGEIRPRRNLLWFCTAHEEACASDTF